MIKSVAILLYTNVGSGGLKVIYRIANGLLDRGYDVTLYFAEKEDFALSQYDTRAKKSFASKNIPLKLFPRLKYLMGLEIKADIIMATYFPTAIAAKFNQKISGKKYYYVQAYEPHFFNFRLITFIRRIHYYLLSKLSYLINLKMVVNCEGSAKGPGKGNFKAMIPPGIDLNVYVDNPGRNNKKLRIGHISRLERRKGTQEFFEAMVILKNKAVDFEVLIAYDQWKNSPFTHYDVVIPKNEAELVAFYQSCDIVVSTVWEKGFAYPPLETMACGAISLSTPIDYGNPWEDYIPITVNSPESIVNGVLWVIENPEKAEEIRKNALAFSNQYGWSRIIDQWHALFEENS